MNRTFATICLSYLAAAGVPAIVFFALGFWMHEPDALSIGLRSVPLSSIFAALVIFLWLCGPPKPTNRAESVGRWFIVFIMSAGVGFVCTAWPPLLVSIVDHTQLTWEQNFLILQNTVWGFISGLAAGLVLQRRETRAKAG